MFRERIDQTPFTSEEANYFFKNITAENEYAGDKSFLATARAVLADRIPEGESLTIRYSSARISKTEADGAVDGFFFNRLISPWESRANTIQVMELVDGDTLDRCFGAVRMWSEGDGNAWEPVDQVEALFRKSFHANCYINREKQSAVLLVDRLSLRKWHSIQVILFRCVPWFFPEEHPITEDEKNLFRSLSKDNPTEYLNILRQRSAKYDFEKSRIQRLLEGFETTYERRRIESCKSEIERKRRQIDDYNNSISSLITEMRQLNISVMGAIAAMEQRSGESELMDYFLADRNLNIESANDGTLRFFVKGYLTDFNEDEAEACINNTSSFVSQERSGARISRQDMRRLMKAVFVDGLIRIRVCAAYSFYIDDRVCVEGQSNKRFPAEYSTYLPNPHIQSYSCMGSHKRIINDLLLAGDYVGAVAQCEVSAASLNWGDWAVMGSFMDRMYTDDAQYFELPDGKCVNQVDAVNWLNEQEGKK